MISRHLGLRLRVNATGLSVIVWEAGLNTRRYIGALSKVRPPTGREAMTSRVRAQSRQPSVRGKKRYLVDNPLNSCSDDL
jgi:hypothetical protein